MPTPCKVFMLNIVDLVLVYNSSEPTDGPNRKLSWFVGVGQKEWISFSSDFPGGMMESGLMWIFFRYNLVGWRCFYSG